MLSVHDADDWRMTAHCWRSATKMSSPGGNNPHDCMMGSLPFIYSTLLNMQFQVIVGPCISNYIKKDSLFDVDTNHKRKENMFLSCHQIQPRGFLRRALFVSRILVRPLKAQAFKPYSQTANRSSAVLVSRVGLCVRILSTKANLSSISTACWMMHCCWLIDLPL